jgi:uncharacterized protein YlaI
MTTPKESPEPIAAFDYTAITTEYGRRAAEQASSPAKAKPAKCPNVRPLQIWDQDNRPLRSSICPECGGNLAILSSGKFRTHNRVFKVGDPRISENVQAAEKARGDLA